MLPLKLFLVEYESSILSQLSFVYSYLHSTFSPPVVHGNLKAVNVLLDENLMPRVTDCGLAILRPLTSNKVKVRVSFYKNQHCV